MPPKVLAPSGVSALGVCFTVAAQLSASSCHMRPAICREVTAHHSNSHGLGFKPQGSTRLGLRTPPFARWRRWLETRPFGQWVSEVGYTGPYQACSSTWHESTRAKGAPGVPRR